MFAEEDEEDDGKLDDEVHLKLTVHTVGAFLTTNVLIMELSSIRLPHAVLLCLGALCSMEYN